MTTKLVRTTMAMGAVVAILASALDADAASARVRCRVRAERTQISVDGRSLAAGSYTATVDSTTDAGGAVTSKNAVAVGGRVREAEFDFDSNPVNVAAGATALPASFVTLPGSVNWQLLQNGNVILSGTQACGR